MGATMPDIPEGKFAGVFVLSERQEIPTPDQELNSIFVFEKRTYIDKQPLIDIEINRETGEAQQITTNHYYRGEIVNGSAIETLVADETNAYWDLDENGFGNVARQLSDNWWEVSQRQWINLADIWEWELDRRGPLKFYCPSDETSLTETTTGNAPGPLSPLPDVEVGQMVKIIKWGGYMRYTTVSRNNAGLRVINELGYLPDDGYSYPVQNELVEDSEVPDDRVEADATGRVVEYEGIEGCLAVKTERQGLSLEVETEEVSSRLKPQKYITGGSVTSSETQTATDGSLSMETATEGQENVFTQKGVIAKLKTTTQEGDLTPLTGAQVNPQDGISYETLEEAVSYDEVTTENMDVDGNVTEYVPIDGNFARRVVSNALSTEAERELVADRLPPAKFYTGGGNPDTYTTITVDDTPPEPTEANIDEKVQYSNKGRITQEQVTTISGEPTPLPATSFDERTGIGYLGTQEIVPIDEAEQTEVGEDGTVAAYIPYNADYAIKTTSTIVSPETREWIDIVNYEWPPVLKSVELKTYPRRSGTPMVVPVLRFKEGFKGPQEVEVKQYWQKEPVIPTSPSVMIPEGFRHQTPYYTVDAPPCLHDTITFTTTTGTTDPVWENISETETFDPTNFTDWPDFVSWKESKPYMGGYIITEWKLNKPVT
jgi:hypothetical protein